MTKKALKLALEALHGFIPYLHLNDEAQCGRYDEAIAAIKEALALQALHDENERLGLYKDAYAQQEQEPVDFSSLLREAEEIVRGKPTWKRFIDGTPLSNDIVVWMAVFAQDVARRTSPPQRKPLTDEEIDQGLLRTNYAFKTAEAWRAGVEWAMTQLKEKQ